MNKTRMEPRRIAKAILPLVLVVAGVVTLSMQPVNQNDGERHLQGTVEGSTWDAATIVSSESTTYAGEPTIALDAGGNVHVAWEDASNIYGSGTDQDIFYKTRAVSSATWGSGEVVSTASVHTALRSAIAVDAGGNVHVAWEEIEDGALDYDIHYRMRDAGTGTWGSPAEVSPGTTYTSQRPAIAIDTDGNVHVVFQHIAGEGLDYAICYRMKNATTDTWGSIHDVSTSTGPSVEPAIAIDAASTVHVAWEEYSGSDWDIVHRALNITAGTWNTIQVVSTESTGHSNFPAIAVDAAGILHVAWQDRTNYQGCGTDVDVFYKQREANGTWGSTVVVSTESTQDSRVPSIAVEMAGTVHVAWVDGTNLGGAGPDIDVFYKMHNVTTGTWEPVQVVSTGTSESYTPGICVDQAGGLHVTWSESSKVYHAQLAAPPSAPQQLVATPARDRVALTWLPPAKAGSTPVSGYAIYRAASAGGLATCITTVAGTSFTDTGLRAGETWFYSVHATNNAGEGPASTMVNATTWRGTEVVTAGRTATAEDPNVGIDAGGTVHVTWQEIPGAGEQEVLYRARTAGGAWGLVEVVSNGTTQHSQDPSMATEPSGKVHVAWQEWDGTRRRLRYTWRDPGTGSWAAHEIASGDRPGQALDSAIAVDDQGNVHVAWREEGASMTYEIYYAWRNASSGSWCVAEHVSSGSNKSLHPSIAMDGNSIAHVCWSEWADVIGSGTDQDVFHRARTMTTGTWSAIELVSSESSDNSMSPSTIVDNAGNLHVTWADYTQLPGTNPGLDVFHKIKNATTGSWTTTSIVSATGDANAEQPSMAVAPDGTVHAAWIDASDDDAEGDYDIYHATFDALAGTWSTNEPVSTESDGPSFQPSIAVGPDGTVHAAWQDMSDYGNAGPDEDIFYKALVPVTPVSPGTLDATPGNRSVVLGWDAPADEGGAPVTNYSIYRSSTSGSGHAWIANTTDLQYTDTGLVNGQPVHYLVRAWNIAGEGPASNEASATPVAVPTAPRDVQATAGIRHVNLTWTGPEDAGGMPVTGYTIFWSTDGMSFTAIDAGNATSFTHEGLGNGQDCHYKVAARNALGNGTNSSDASARTFDLPGPVTGLVATGGDGVVTLTWNPPLPTGGDELNITTYMVYRSTTSGSGFTWIANVTATSFTDNNVENGVTYHYRVVAWNDAGEGASTTEPSATPAVQAAPVDDTWIFIVVVLGSAAAVAAVIGVLQVNKRKNAKKGARAPPAAASE